MALYRKRRNGPKDWSPRNPFSADQIWQTLRKLAPSVVFSIHREADANFVWDGDGPDPANEGYVAYDIEVKAAIIAEGRYISNSAYLSGSYDIPGDFDQDVHGYLPQMIVEAADGLSGHSIPKYLQEELQRATAFLTEAMKVRHERQQREQDRGGS